MCAGCGSRVAKRELVRFTVRGGKDHLEVVLDPSGTRGGRGAYLCASTDCLEQALKKKALLRRLKAAAEKPDLREEFVRLVKHAGDE
jgi:hypothetical protein